MRTYASAKWVAPSKFEGTINKMAIEAHKEGEELRRRIEGKRILECQPKR